MLEKHVQFHPLLNDKLHERWCHAEAYLLQQADIDEAIKFYISEAFKILPAFLTRHNSTNDQ